MPPEKLLLAIFFSIEKILFLTISGCTCTEKWKKGRNTSTKNNKRDFFVSKWSQKFIFFVFELSLYSQVSKNKSTVPEI